jgi:hypothetical protein
MAGTRIRGVAASAIIQQAQEAGLNRREMYSLERMSLGWAWNNARHAAALACELIRWAMPSTRWLPADSDAVRDLDARLGAEEPVGDPYRTAGEQRVNADPPEVVDARFEVSNVLTYIMMFVEGQPITAPPGVGQPAEHPLTRLYWHAAELGKRVEAACNVAANTLYQGAVTSTSENGIRKINVPEGIAELRARWGNTGRAAKDATEFLRKFATGNPVIGEVDGAAGGILNRISLALVYAGKPTEEITGRMFHWRVKDALKGKELSPELDANLRPAFEAAWAAGEYEFAYSLLADLDTIADL